MDRQSFLFQQGFTYLSLIFAVAILSIALGVSSELWSSVQKREKERELLIIGDQFRNAIGSYYEKTPGGGKQYPPTLEDLVKDNRNVVPMRHLRKIYPDPLTGQAKWDLIIAPTGGIMGIKSLSNAKPVKIANFEIRYKEFEGKEKYSDWRFVYTPQTPINNGLKETKSPQSNSQ